MSLARTSSPLDELAVKAVLEKLPDLGYTLSPPIRHPQDPVESQFVSCRFFIFPLLRLLH